MSSKLDKLRQKQKTRPRTRQYNPVADDYEDFVQNKSDDDTREEEKVLDQVSDTSKEKIEKTAEETKKEQSEQTKQSEEPEKKETAERSDKERADKTSDLDESKEKEKKLEEADEKSDEESSDILPDKDANRDSINKEDKSESTEQAETNESTEANDSDKDKNEDFKEAGMNVSEKVDVDEKSDNLPVENEEENVIDNTPNKNEMNSDKKTAADSNKDEDTLSAESEDKANNLVNDKMPEQESEKNLQNVNSEVKQEKENEKNVEVPARKESDFVEVKDTEQEIKIEDKEPEIISEKVEVDNKSEQPIQSESTEQPVQKEVKRHVPVFADVTEIESTVKTTTLEDTLSKLDKFENERLYIDSVLESNIGMLEPKENEEVINVQDETEISSTADLETDLSKDSEVEEVPVAEYVEVVDADKVKEDSRESAEAKEDSSVLSESKYSPRKEVKKVETGQTKSKQNKVQEEPKEELARDTKVKGVLIEDGVEPFYLYNYELSQLTTWGMTIDEDILLSFDYFATMQDIKRYDLINSLVEMENGWAKEHPEFPDKKFVIENLKKFKTRRSLKSKSEGYASATMVLTKENKRFIEKQSKKCGMPMYGFLEYIIAKYLGKEI